jgi:hypothetical protein
MRISFGTIEVEFSSQPSRLEMEKRLSNAGLKYELIDTANEYSRCFYSLEFKPQMERQQSSRRSIGLSSSRTGVEPQLLLNLATNLLYLGIDQSVFIFSTLAAPTRRLDLTSPFYWMALFSTLDRILVVHEIGILWLDTNGDIVWRHDAADIISSVALQEPRTVELQLLEGGRTNLDLVTGTVLD